MDPRPFAGAELAWLVLPPDGDEQLAELVVREQAEFAAELGAPVRVRRSGSDGGGPRLFLDLPGAPHPELAAWRRQTERRPASGPAVELAGDVVVVTAGDDPGTALSLLRTAVRTGVAGVLTPRPAVTTAEAADRLVAEIGWTYPAFALRGVDCPAISARHREPADLADLQRWVADLCDPYTSVRAAGATAGAPVHGAGRRRRRQARACAAVERRLGGRRRPGDLLVAVGGAPVDAAQLLATTGAAARTLARFAGRRTLTVPGATATDVTVRRASGGDLAWLDGVEAAPVSWSRLPSGTGYLRIHAWSDPDALDAALAELGASDRLIVDVRGNSGGGSGRPRTVALQRGVVLSVSTALTYEPDGRCVEGAGLAVGRVLPPDLLATGAAVVTADTGW